MTQAHLIISGTVQGVGFRYFIRSWAKKLGITGWTRNTEEGAVEAVLQGDKKNLEQIITLCRKGPFLSQVKDVQLKWEVPVETLMGFSIRT